MPEARQQLGALTPPDWLAVWLAEIGVWVRTAGAWPGDAEPIDSVVALGDRPLAIFYGTADTFDVPDRNAQVLFQAAQSAGVPVEIHACKDAAPWPGGRHLPRRVPHLGDVLPRAGGRTVTFPGSVEASTPWRVVDPPAPRCIRFVLGLRPTGAVETDH